MPFCPPTLQPAAPGARAPTSTHANPQDNFPLLPTSTPSPFTMTPLFSILAAPQHAALLSVVVPPPLCAADALSLVRPRCLCCNGLARTTASGPGRGWAQPVSEACRWPGVGPRRRAGAGGVRRCKVAGGSVAAMGPPDEVHLIRPARLVQQHRRSVFDVCGAPHRAAAPRLESQPAHLPKASLQRSRRCSRACAVFKLDSRTARRAAAARPARPGPAASPWPTAPVAANVRLASAPSPAWASQAARLRASSLDQWLWQPLWRS